ncbi:MAG: ABC transporter substrate-binding protein [Rhodospirillaceae bacterium]|nr:ABC transporter substrate-binding protein [Rhodospirillales bacterium]
MRLRLIAFFGLIAVAMAVAGWTMTWNRAKPMKVIGVLNNAVIANKSLEGLRQGLAQRGWRENETIRFLYAGPEPSPDRLRAQAREYVEQGVDLMISLSTPAGLVAREATQAAGVPLLLCPASDPVAAGLVTSLTHPGQAVTGVTFALQEPRRLEWLKRLIPNLRVIWVPFNHSDPSPTATLVRLREAAAKLDITIEIADVRSMGELSAALNTIPPSVEAIFIPSDAFLASQTQTILTAAWARGLPVTTPHREGVAQGALFSYGFDLTALGRQAARLADQILSGTPATDLPIEAAEMDLSINLVTADRLGLAVPDDVLRHAFVLGRE